MATARIERLFDAEAIRARVAAIAAQIARDHADTPFAIVCIAEGSLRFAADLFAALEKHDTHPERYEVRARRSAGQQLGTVRLDPFDPEALTGRDVIVLDDLADEGETLAAVLALVTEAEPRSVRSAVLVDKTERRRRALSLDYVGFRVEAGWIVGYGMDLDGAYRDQDWIGRLVDDRF